MARTPASAKVLLALGLLLAVCALAWLLLGGEAPGSGGTRAVRPPPVGSAAPGAGGSRPADLEPAAPDEPLQRVATSPDAGPEGPAQPPPEPAPERFELRVVVLDDFGLGVADQLVFLGSVEAANEAPLEATSGPLGELAFEGLEAGRYVVVADGRGLPEGLLAGPERELEVPADGPVTLQLLRAGSIEGYVRWPEGTGVQGATVRSGHSWASRQAVTDAAGYYRIEGLPPGDYRVRIADLPVLERPASYPREVALTLNEGDRHVAPDLVLAESSAGVAGRVLDDAGDPIANLPVACFYGPWQPGSDSERDAAGTDLTNEAGEFLIEELAAGPAHVIAGFGRKAYVSEPRPVVLIEGKVVHTADQRLRARGR